MFGDPWDTYSRRRRLRHQNGVWWRKGIGRRVLFSSLPCLLRGFPFNIRPLIFPSVYSSSSQNSLPCLSRAYFCFFLSMVCRMWIVTCFFAEIRIHRSTCLNVMSILFFYQTNFLFCNAVLSMISGFAFFFLRPRSYHCTLITVLKDRSIMRRDFVIPLSVSLCSSICA